MIECPESIKIYEEEKKCLNECYYYQFEYQNICYNDCKMILIEYFKIGIYVQLKCLKIFILIIMIIYI